MGSELKSGGSGDPTVQAQLIETYVADNVDGIIVSLANPDAMKDAVKKAVDAGIPVITINSGVDVYKEFGAITHVGQTEFVAGQGAGEQFNAAGLSKALCVIHEEGNIGLEERCDGLEDTFQGEATFDLSPDVLEAIEAGKIMFAIDQQQYLQGYLPVVFLYLYNANLNTVGGGLPVLTGPGIVDASNAAAVKDLAAAGTR